MKGSGLYEKPPSCGAVPGAGCRTAASSFLGAITAPLQGAGTAAMRAIGDALGVNDHTEELEALKEENRLLREQLVDYYEVKRQNIQYASILDIKEQNKDFEFVAAAVIGRDPNDLYYGFSIDQGSLSGVSVNDRKVESIDEALGCEQFTGEGVIIRKGKKVFHRVVLV